MIAGNRRASLEGRVERIERAIAAPPPVEQPLSRFELRELLELERERDRQFPRRFRCVERRPVSGWERRSHRPPIRERCSS